MRWMVLLAISLGAAGLFGPRAGWGQPSQVEPDGVICVSPARAGSCFAVRLGLPKTQALAGVRWYNNDGTVVFSRLVLAEAPGKGEPHRESGLTVAEGTAGSCGGWTEVAFSEPVASTTAAVDVIFELQDGSELTARGTGGGAGWGYRRLKGGPVAFVSADGLEWARLLADCCVLVEPVLVTRDEDVVLLGPSEKAGLAKPAAWETALLAPRPNPANPGVTIMFTLGKEARTELFIYDLRGRQVATLLQAPLSAGPHEVLWQGRDGFGRPVSSGVYFARLKTGNETFSRRLMVIR